jgi:hypothetical protein
LGFQPSSPLLLRLDLQLRLAHLRKTPNSMSYEQLGVCLRGDGSFKANDATSLFSYVLSADSVTGNIVASGWASTVCSGTALATGVSYGTKTTCACTASSCSMSNYYLATLPSFISPVKKYSSYYGSKFCNGTATSEQLTQLTAVASNDNCRQDICYFSGSSATQTSCLAPTGIISSGYVRDTKFSVS